MRLHDTRHTYVTLLQEKKVSPIDAMGRTGHSDMQMLSHYSHPKSTKINLNLCRMTKRKCLEEYDRIEQILAAR